MELRDKDEIGKGSFGSVLRDCAIIIWRGDSKINREGPELKPKRRVGGVRCHFLNICSGVRS